VHHAVLSADRGPAGMFRRFPFFDRLISWTKPYPPLQGGALAEGRFDWNSLLSTNKKHAGLVRKEMDKTSYFPRRIEMERGLTKFASLTGLQVRYNCHWEKTRRREGTYTLSTSEGDYEAPLIIFGIGITEPWLPPLKGSEHITHYVELKTPRHYAGRRVLIVGKRNSGFETAHGLLPWASRIVMASPSPVSFSINVGHPSAARAVYMQPYEDHVLGGGHYVLDAVPAGIERTSGALRVTLEGTTVPGKEVFEVDEVIGATGFKMPVNDLGEIGVTTFGHQQFPVLTPFWESPSAPGIYFVGSASQGAAGLKKYGRASNSGVVNGFRHNARVLADHLATTKFGRSLPRRGISKRDLPAYLLDVACNESALWNQQAYLAQVIDFPAPGKAQDAGLQPLAHFLDSSDKPGVALTVETSPDEGTHPTLYLRNGRSCGEHRLEAGPLLEFRSPRNRAALRTLLKGF
jgi:thioredoxin reductase